jgi:hypothetical protein
MEYRDVIIQIRGEFEQPNSEHLYLAKNIHPGEFLEIMLQTFAEDGYRETQTINISLEMWSQIVKFINEK